ncbi:hypothetical protein [Mycobacterium sp. ITM-2016-00318]|uniref:hypothetical protein n=1 Tax=Mycobacterium sp. ITM-2016-00318 TaxID=2099693 RepID=UPI000CF9E81F|nr:hypothetical protein [Mycobacterium sp. ITM-2016-00318]WNG92219.1 hypothetical protein C6A82_022840 [Mycobacterium sp. ITM-2016-00318]
MSPEITFLAHGVGGSTDLPVPLSYALIGAVWALVFTFAVVAVAWKTPKFDPTKPGRALPQWVTRIVDSPAIRRLVAAMAMAFTGWVAVAAIWGPQDGNNALPGVFYVLLWVGLVAASIAVGPLWRVVSPARTLYRLFGIRRNRHPDREPRLAYPNSWGYWPAALGLFGFVWLELASPAPGSLTAIKIWILVYAVVMLGGAAAFGTRWFARADPFEVYSVAASRLSPFRRNGATGRVVVGNPLDHLPSMPVRPGTLAVLAVLLGSTAFDSFSAAPTFRNWVDRNAASVPLVDDTMGGALLRSVGLLFFVVVVGVTFSVAARATGGVTREQRRQLPGRLAHCLIPIVVGYIFAHYLSYLVERGQETVVRLADPLGRGWHPLGLDSGDVVYFLSLNPTLLWTIKVACVVIGHVLGVVAAHDQALRVLPTGHQLVGQLAMMLTMVAYTLTGLYLLFGG